MVHYNLRDPSRNYKKALDFDFHIVDGSFLQVDSSCLRPINK